MWDRVFAGKRASPLGMVGSNLQETSYRITKGGEGPKIAPKVIVLLNGYINLRWRGDDPTPMMDWLVRWLRVSTVGGSAASTVGAGARMRSLMCSLPLSLSQASYPKSKVAVMALLPVNSTYNDAVMATNVQVGAERERWELRAWLLLLLLLLGDASADPADQPRILPFPSCHPQYQAVANATGALWVDCTSSGYAANNTLHTLDGTHPAAAGQQLLLQCLKRAVWRHMA